MSDSGPIDLADLQLKPQWIDDLDKPNPFQAFEGKDARDGRKPRRDGFGGGGGGPRGRGPGGGGGGGRPQQRSSGGGGGRPQQRGGGAGGGGNRQGQGGDRRQGGGQRRDGRGPRQSQERQRPERPPLYELIDIELIPDKAGLEAVAKQIKMTGRSYPIFDLARLSLGGPERYHATFTMKPETKQVQLVECRADKSLWLSMGEAVRHFSNSPLFSKYYKKEEIEVEPPKGNFTVVAVCGLSGALLGPPNFHSYQKNLMDLHQRKFSRMHIDGYKRKIQMVRDEETIEKWKNSLTKSTQYTYIYGLKPEAAPEPDAPKAEAAAPQADETAPSSEVVADALVSEEATALAESPEASANSAAPETETTESAATVETSNPSAEEVAAPSESAPAEEEKPAVPEVVIPADAPVFKTKAEAEKHFQDTHGKEIFVPVKSSTVPGNIPPKLISGALHNMLTRNAERQAKIPMPMVRNISPLLEKAGLRFFKLGGKEIYVARSRPRALSGKIDVSPRIRAIVQYIRDNEKQDLNKLVTALVPNVATRESSEPSPEEIEFLKDLRWLIREGYVIEFSNGELRLGSLKGPLPNVKRDARGPLAEAPAKKKKKRTRKRSRKRSRKGVKSPAQRLQLRVAKLKLKRRLHRKAIDAAAPARRRARASDRASTGSLPSRVAARRAKRALKA